MSANVSKELSNGLCVVTVNDLAKPLLFLGFEEEGGHLRFVHFGASGGSGHADDHTVWRLERWFSNCNPGMVIDAAA